MSSRLALAALVLGPFAALAGPVTIAHEGYLLDGQDHPVSGAVEMGFSISTSPAGAPIWSEAQTVPVAAGYYAVVLGTTTPLAAGVFEAATLYLEVTVDGVALAPRQLLASVGSAAVSISTQGLQGRAVATTAPADGQVLAWSAAAGAWGPAATGGLQSLNGQGAADQSFANDSNVTIASAGGVHSLGWAGQLPVSRGGTGSADGSIHAPGELVLRPGATNNLYLMRNAAGTSWSTGILHVGAGDVSPSQTLLNGGQVFVRNRLLSYDWQITNANAPGPSYLANYPGAKLGIGLTSPAEKLSVAGVVQSTTGGFRFPDDTVQTTAAASLGPSSTPQFARLGLGTPADAVSPLVVAGDVKATTLTLGAETITADDLAALIALVRQPVSNISPASFQLVSSVGIGGSAIQNYTWDQLDANLANGPPFIWFTTGHTWPEGGVTFTLGQAADLYLGWDSRAGAFPMAGWVDSGRRGSINLHAADVIHFYRKAYARGTVNIPKFHIDWVAGIFVVQT